MKNLTIYDVYVKMQDQEQCDRMLLKDITLVNIKGPEAVIIDRSYQSYGYR